MRWLMLALVIAAGLLSRATHTGLILIDKYLGDALYAVMIYLLLPGRFPSPKAAWAMAIMAGLECFQLTGIPAEMAQKGTTLLRLAGRLLGTSFHWYDLVAYAAGIGCAYLVETRANTPGNATSVPG